MWRCTEVRKIVAPCTHKKELNTDPLEDFIVKDLTSEHDAASLTSVSLFVTCFIHPEISTSDRTRNARTGPETPQAEAQSHTRNSNTRTHTRQTDLTLTHTHTPGDRGTMSINRRHRPPARPHSLTEPQPPPRSARERERLGDHRLRELHRAPTRLGQRMFNSPQVQVHTN